MSAEATAAAQPPADQEEAENKGKTTSTKSKDEEQEQEQEARRAQALRQVEQDGFALQSLPPDLRNDREVVLAAIRSKASALKFASLELRSDKELVLAAVRQDDMIDPHYIGSGARGWHYIYISTCHIAALGDPGPVISVSITDESSRSSGADGQQQSSGQANTETDSLDLSKSSQTTRDSNSHNHSKKHNKNNHLTFHSTVSLSGRELPPLSITREASVRSLAEQLFWLFLDTMSEEGRALGKDWTEVPDYIHIVLQPSNRRLSAFDGLRSLDSIFNEELAYIQQSQELPPTPTLPQRDD